MIVHNLIGQKFGKLTVIARGENSSDGKSRWVCICDCGRKKEKPVKSTDLQSGKVRSCGCLYVESNKCRNKTHGMTGNRLHRIWCSMRQRCNYTNGASYKNYGGRGISICEEWNNFQTFFEWANSNGYRDGLTLDRIDVNGNYCPENCRWATMKEQQNNRRTNRTVLYGGNTYRPDDLSKILGLTTPTLLWRINNGWCEADLKLTPNLNNKNIRRQIHE